MDAWINSKIMSLCRLYWSCSREVEGRVRLDAISREVGKWCREVEQGMRVEEPGTLLVLLDAYEVTRDEGMLQRVLDVVGEGLERLPVVVESVKLLAYCYYYVEDECLPLWGRDCCVYTATVALRFDMTTFLPVS